MAPPRRNDSLVPADRTASSPTGPHKLQHTLLGVDVPIDADFEPVPRESGGSNDASSGNGGAPIDPQRGRLGRREPSVELVVVEPSYSNVPLPPWVRVHDVEPERDASKELVMLHAPASIAAQQFRTMRYRIEQEPDAQIIAVVSPRSGEGRSVTAANLAIALAEGGRVRVLLVDASLSRPAQANLFALEKGEGLTRVLRERRDDPHAPVHVYGIRGSLYVLPAGPRVMSAHAALASEQAAHLLGACRRAFRYIVVDASPVFGSAETLAWHGMIDRYILVARRGMTTTDDLGRAAERLHREKVLGVTFVGADPKHCVA